MSKVITPLTLQDIKIAAKRLRNELPEVQHIRLLDIAAHALTGTANYKEAIQKSKKILLPSKTFSADGIFSSERDSWAKRMDAEATFNKGFWYFFAEERALVFEGEFSPYLIGLKQINTTGKLLDMTLQIHKKKWPKEIWKKENICPDYQTDEFLNLVNDLCLYYFGDSIQGVFSPGGKVMKIDWDSAINSKQKTESLV